MTMLFRGIFDVTACAIRAFLKQAAGIGVCEKGALWELALALPAKMTKARMSCNAGDNATAKQHELPSRRT